MRNLVSHSLASLELVVCYFEAYPFDSQKLRFSGQHALQFMSKFLLWFLLRTMSMEILSPHVMTLGDIRLLGSKEMNPSNLEVARA